VKVRITNMFRVVCFMELKSHPCLCRNEWWGYWAFILVISYNQKFRQQQKTTGALMLLRGISQK